MICKITQNLVHKIFYGPNPVLFYRSIYCMVRCVSIGQWGNSAEAVTKDIDLITPMYNCLIYLHNKGIMSHSSFVILFGFKAYLKVSLR